MNTGMIKKLVERMQGHLIEADYQGNREDYGAVRIEQEAAEKIEKQLAEQGITVEETDDLEEVAVLHKGFPWLRFHSANWHWLAASEWYYWTHSDATHFIRWRKRGEQMARASIRQVREGMFVWTITVSGWPPYEETESERELAEAIKAVEQRLDGIIARAFRQEYVTLLG